MTKRLLILIAGIVLGPAVSAAPAPTTGGIHPESHAPVAIARPRGREGG